MNFKTFAGFGFIIGLTALTGCAPSLVWDRPGTTPAQVSMDNAQCRLYAEGENPDPGVDTIRTGKIGRDVAANLIVGALHGMAQGAAVGHTFDLCMQAKGYVASAAGATPLPVAAAPVPPTVGIAGVSPAPIPPWAESRVSAGPMPIPLSQPVQTSECPSDWFFGEHLPETGGPPKVICYPYYGHQTVRVF